MSYYSRNKKVSLVSAVSVGLVLVLLVSTLGFLSKGFTDWNAKQWFKDKGKKVEQVIGIDDEGTEMVSGNVYNLSKQMTLMSTFSTDVTLQATVLPEETTNKKVDWAVAWVNPSSTWANGKVVTNYVTVTPTMAGATTANLACLAAFGEQIKIIVKSQSNPDAKAECIVDYMKRLTGFSINGTGFKDNESLTRSGSITMISVTSFFDFTITGFTPVLGVGTVTEEYVLTSSYRRSSPDLYDLLSPMGGTLPDFTPKTGVGHTYSVGYAPFGLSENDLTAEQRNSVAASCKNLLRKLFAFDFTLTGSYSELSGSFTFSGSPDFDIATYAESISLDNNNIIL